MPRPKRAAVDVGHRGADVIPVMPVSKLDIFEQSPIQLSLDGYTDFEVWPTTFFQANSPISFHIPASEHFLDPNFYVEMWCKISKSDKADIGKFTECHLQKELTYTYIIKRMKEK